MSFSTREPPTTRATLSKRSETIRAEHYYVNVPNNWAVPNLPETALLELECIVNRGGPRPIPAPAMPCGLVSLQPPDSWRPTNGGGGGDGGRAICERIRVFSCVRSQSIHCQLPCDGGSCVQGGLGVGRGTKRVFAHLAE